MLYSSQRKGKRVFTEKRRAVTTDRTLIRAVEDIERPMILCQQNTGATVILCPSESLDSDAKRLLCRLLSISLNEKIGEFSANTGGNFVRT